MKFAVVVFPGSNSDHDAHYAVEHPLGEEARYVWHKETSLGDIDAVIRSTVSRGPRDATMSLHS